MRKKFIHKISSADCSLLSSWKVTPYGIKRAGRWLVPGWHGSYGVIHSVQNWFLPNCSKTRLNCLRDPWSSCTELDSATRPACNIILSYVYLSLQLPQLAPIGWGSKTQLECQDLVYSALWGKAEPLFIFDCSKILRNLSLWFSFKSFCFWSMK